MADNIPITAGSGTNIASDDVSSVHYQRMKRSVGADGSATDFLDKSSRSDTYTGAANGTAVDVSAQGMATFGLQVNGTGAAATAWNVVLEGSLNGTNYSTIAVHVNTVHSDGQVVWVAASPCLYFRSRCVSVTLGSATNVVATIVGTPAGAGGSTVAVGSNPYRPTGIAAGSHIATAVALVNAAGAHVSPSGSATGSAVPSGADYAGISVGGTLRGATGLGVGSHYAQSIAVVDASGNQITSFGGTSGVVSTYHLITAGTTNAVNIKASAGTLKAVRIYNNASYPVYIKCHNTSGTPTAGSGVVYTVGCQAGLARDVVLSGGGRSFTTGIGITVVKDMADASTTAVALNDAQLEIEYE